MFSLSSYLTMRLFFCLINHIFSKLINRINQIFLYKKEILAFFSTFSGTEEKYPSVDAVSTKDTLKRKHIQEQM